LIAASYMYVFLLHSWRDEFSMVKRAGNSCSPVRGSLFLLFAMPRTGDVVYWCVYHVVNYTVI
jgi:hypothetical protein